MSKWTQQQRAKAIRDTEAMMMASDRTTAVESYDDAAIELACQRNELLEALKDQKQLMGGYKYSLERDGAHVAARQVADRIEMVTALIAKSEGK